MNSRTQKIFCCVVTILISTDAAARLCIRRELWRWYLKIYDVFFQMLCRSFIYHVEFRKYVRTKLSLSFWITLYFMNGVVLTQLRRIFGPKRDEVTGEWRKLHNEELRDLYSSPNIFRVIKSRRMRWAGHVERMGERIGAYRGLVGKPEGNRSLGRPTRRWEDNIKMNLLEVGCGGMDWIDLAQDRDRWWALVNAVVNPRVP